LSDALQGMWKVFVQFMTNVWQKFFKNGNVIGNIDVSLRIVFAIQI